MYQQVGPGISDILQRAGESLVNGGHVYYVAMDIRFGLMALIDASEMPDTYGSAYDEVRAFIQEGWTEVNNVEGDLSNSNPLLRYVLRCSIA